jgi:UPF0716 protein FxsA
MPLFALFIIIPLIEISLFVLVGERIGLGTTLLLCLITALIGGYLVRKQGLDTLFKGQKSLNDGYLPLQELFDGFCIVIAGALLMTPGFFTDVIGFALLTPPVRVHLRNFLEKRIHIIAGYSTKAENRKPTDDPVIEGEYERLDEDDSNG